jgi:hypothetical protein
MHSSLLQSRMKPSICLGFNDEDGNPQVPIYAIGELINPGLSLPSRKNHAQYMDKAGHYDIVSYLYNHKNVFRGIYHVGVGQLCPHISIEVDCKNIFS